uniref:Xrn1 N-terminal domain-containing protein n=1 Tax=viral metagenome TaxID=1070528 RepID=A0A6C0DGY8_9ZZZZ
MGIPSYYRRLTKKNKNLVRRSNPGSVDWLWMDFNCLIYHCLRRPDLRPYPGPEGQEAWEAELLAAVVAYTKKVVALVNPAKGVYIAVDGVVPMAKMKQQRLRRFKSAWLTEHGLAEGQDASSPKERWDTNAITPGTEFMGKLRKVLEKMNKKWIISSSDEPGEGEHKIMEQWRRCCSATPTRRHSLAVSTDTTYAVYGLDADLVVLSLLTQDTVSKTTSQPLSVYLFREEIEDGSMVRDATGEEQFQWFSIDALRDTITETMPIREYCFAMSFLGNDFLPSALGLKMREDGHEVLMDLVAHLQGTSPLLDEKGCPSVVGLTALFKSLASMEEKRVLTYVRNKVRQSDQYASDLVLGDPNWPMVQGEENRLLSAGDWRSVYRRSLQGSEGMDGIRTYLQGLGWIWDYYRGVPVCYNWYFPWSVPPLWSDLAKGLTENPGYVKAVPIVVGAADILTAEQLCLVLPPSSWNLIPSTASKQRRFMTVAPWYFPSEFEFCSIGRRFFWECEPKIPIPSIQEVKLLLS